MIKIKSLKGATTQEIGKLDQALVLANRTWNEQAFWDGVKMARFDGVSGTAVSNRLTMADPALFALDLYIYNQPWYKRWSSETAVENPDGSIGFERRYFTRATLPELVNTIFHEVSHKAGFSHDFRATARRPWSVPYLVGSIAERIASALLSAPKVQAESVVEV
jgi:hypothetical protein